MQKDDSMVTYFKTKTDEGQNLIDDFFSNFGCQWTFQPATSSYSVKGDFLQYIYSVSVTNNHQHIRSRCLVHEVSFTYIF